MNLHKHARLPPLARALLAQHVEQRLRVEVAAQAAGVSARTAYKGLRRLRTKVRPARKIAHHDRGSVRISPRRPA
ncbi:leucine zipper domain-containing protein [Stutzerimonas kunmingensis]|uniref:leucine zipper domain-containing protein n=1 Tax=Stutzerimonas kunmingensis TaxID=1211807 RepID=UPI0035E3CC69